MALIQFIVVVESKVSDDAAFLLQLSQKELPLDPETYQPDDVHAPELRPVLILRVSLPHMFSGVMVRVVRVFSAGVASKCAYWFFEAESLPQVLELVSSA